MLSGATCFPCCRLLAFWASSILDALTDLMGMYSFREYYTLRNWRYLVISIPIAILRQSQMRPSTKVGLGFFLCLSAFMRSCSIIRAALTYYRGKLNYPWQVFWLHSEGCIGVTMGSVTIYRSTLIGSVTEVSNSLRAYIIAKIARWIRGNKGPSRLADSTALPWMQPEYQSSFPP